MLHQASKSDTAGARILVVDDDPELRHFLTQEMMLQGYTCDTAAGGAQALAKIREGEWDLVLLDWSLPDFSGLEVCRQTRATQPNTPILMLTAHDDIRERVEALDAGADDYLTKPFSIEELMARTRARLRRKGLEEANRYADRLQVGDLVLLANSRDVRRGDDEIKLSAREFDLLHHLMQQSGRVCKRQEILAAVWGPTFVGDDNLLDVYVRYLRKKLEPPGKPTLIQTVRGIGFIAKQGTIKA